MMIKAGKSYKENSIMIVKNVSLMKLFSAVYALISISALLTIILFKESNGSNLALIYVLIQCLGIILIWYISNRKLGLFIMFQLTFSLFIGGRFWAYLLNPALDLDIFEPTFFFDYTVSADRKIEIYSYVLLFVIFSILGYSLSRSRNRFKYILNLKVSDTSVMRISKIGNILFPVFAISTLYSTFSTLVDAMAGGGYLLLYSTQANEYSAGGSFIPNLILFFFSFAFAYGDKKLQRKYLILYLFNSVLRLLIGTRSAIGAVFLFAIWLYSLKHKISLLKLFICVVLALVLLLFLFSFSVRATDDGNVFSFDTLLASISIFLYTQGISLMVFDASRLIDAYPLIGYIQTFIPGVTWLWGLMGNSLLPQDVFFTYRMCYELNPSLFINGNGLGWSILSDVYIFSFGSALIFISLSLFIGYLFGCLENLSGRYPFYKYISFYIFMACMLIPRGGGLINLLAYGVVYLCLFCVLTYRKTVYEK